MTEQIAFEETRKKLEQYPTDNIDKHYSIFCVPLHHGLSGQNLKDEEIWESRAKQFQVLGWQLHPYFFNANVQYPRFKPEEIFSDDALMIHFGDNKKTPDSALITGELLTGKLDPCCGELKHGDLQGLTESLFFELDTKTFHGNWTIKGKQLDSTFTIEWVDLLLLNDGLGILSFRTSLVSDKKLTITELGNFHRDLRDMTDSISFSCLATDSENKHGSFNGGSFWKDVVIDMWLGKGKILSSVSNSCKRNPKIDKDQIFLETQRYAKIIAFAQNQIKDPDIPFWNRPLVSPEILFCNEDIENMGKGQWPSPSDNTLQAMLAKYATVRDLFAFELATLSEQYAATGWGDKKEDKKWQYAHSYIRSIINENSVKVWEYWTGVALRDTFVFVSFDKTMPNHQTENRYYPLYLVAYHFRLRLEEISSEAIEYDMADVWHGREIKDQLIRFRNHYWFKEVTKDFVGVEVFDKMKIGMHIDELYYQVNAEVADVSTHLQQKWERWSRVVIAVLVFLFAPIGKLWDKLFDSLKGSIFHISIFCFLVLTCLVLSWWFWPTLAVFLRSRFKWYRRFTVKCGRHREII